MTIRKIKIGAICRPEIKFASWFARPVVVINLLNREPAIIIR